MLIPHRNNNRQNGIITSSLAIIITAYIKNTRVMYLNKISKLPCSINPVIRRSVENNVHQFISDRSTLIFDIVTWRITADSSKIIEKMFIIGLEYIILMDGIEIRKNNEKERI